jgi:mono/diheme cytochrome c family protein
MNPTTDTATAARGSRTKTLLTAAAVLAAVLLATVVAVSAGAGSKQGAAADVAALEHASIPEVPPSGKVAAVERGRYLVTAMGCNDCHTPWKMGPAGPEPDMTRALSGHPEEMVMPPAPDLGGGPWLWAGAATNTAFAGPWGMSFSANLTPDPSGLGAWDEEIFIRAIRTGKHWGQSRPILPPMPWPMIRNLDDGDLGAVFAYLQSLPPVENHVPEPRPPAAADAVAAG